MAIYVFIVQECNQLTGQRPRRYKAHCHDERLSASAKVYAASYFDQLGQRGLALLELRILYKGQSNTLANRPDVPFKLMKRRYGIVVRR